ncbi:hypothetical protein AB0C31_41590, partial [Actinoplanes philippinensis]
MTTEVTLGEVTCPSGHLVITDGGYLEMWSGDRVPDDEEHPATDFAVVGPDAEEAAARGRVRHIRPARASAPHSDGDPRRRREARLRP